MPTSISPPAASDLSSLAPTQSSWRRFARHRLAVLGLGILLGVVALAIFAERLAPRSLVQAARSLGVGDGRLLWHHVLPNILSPALVLASFEVARMIILESTLGFLGLGVQPPTPTWGNMLADGRDYLRDSWWIATFPELAITITAAGVNFLGDGLRDFLDPTIQHTA